jgi:hypothetical protein
MTSPVKLPPTGDGEVTSPPAAGEELMTSAPEELVVAAGEGQIYYMLVDENSQLENQTILIGRRPVIRMSLFMQCCGSGMIFFGSDPGSGSDFSESSGSDPGSGSYSGSCMNTYTHTQISTHIHTYIHTDTQTYTNTNTHIHIHTHIHTTIYM